MKLHWEKLGGREQSLFRLGTAIFSVLLMFSCLSALGYGFEVNEFSDGTTTKDLELETTVYQVVNVTIPRNANVTLGNMTIELYDHYYDDTEDAASHYAEYVHDPAYAYDEDLDTKAWMDPYGTGPQRWGWIAENITEPSGTSYAEWIWTYGHCGEEDSLDVFYKNSTNDWALLWGLQIGDLGDTKLTETLVLPSEALSGSVVQLNTSMYRQDCTNYWEGKIHWYNVTGTRNVAIDSGINNNEDYDNGTFNFGSSQIVDLNETAINDFLRTQCDADIETGFCNVTFNISTNNDSILNLSYLNISWPGNLSHEFNLSVNKTEIYGAFGASPENTIWVNITNDVGPGATLCNITLNTEITENEEYFADTVKSYNITHVDGTNVINVFCRNTANVNHSYTENYTLDMKSYVLVNEISGNAYNITNENIVLYVPNKNISYNFSAEGPTYYYISNTSDYTRIEIQYPTVSGTIIRDFDPGLNDGNITRVCVAPVQTFYEQLLYSAALKGTAIYNPVSDCYIIMDYTKYAYADALMLRGYTIPSFYTLYIWNSTGDKTELGSIDGSLASEINIDLVELAKKEYTISILGEGVSISALTNTTISIYYRNQKEENDALFIQIMNGSTELFTHNETTTPNEVYVIFDHSGLNLTNILLTLKVFTYTDNEETGEITKVFYSNGLSGNLNPDVAIVLSAVLLFFSLTFVAIRYVFGFFGIAMTLTGLAILTQAPSNQYVLFMEGIEILMLIFIIFLFKEEYAKQGVV